MKKNKLLKIRKCIFLLFFASAFAYLGCRGNLKPIIKFTTTVWSFVGKNNQKSLIKAKSEIGFLEEEIVELEKMYAASGISSTARTMKELEESLAKKANQQFSGYYKAFLPLLVMGRDPKQSMQDFVNKSPEMYFDVKTSILTFPIVDTINGISKTIIANIKIGDILEKQKAVQDIEQIQSIEPYSETEQNPRPKVEINNEPKISMDSLLEVVMKKHSSYKIKRYNWGYEIFIKGTPIPFARFKNGKINQINKDPKNGHTDYDYDYIDKNENGYLDSTELKKTSK